MDVLFILNEGPTGEKSHSFKSRCDEFGTFLLIEKLFFDRKQKKKHTHNMVNLIVFYVTLRISNCNYRVHMIFESWNYSESSYG